MKTIEAVATKSAAQSATYRWRNGRAAARGSLVCVALLTGCSSNATRGSSDVAETINTTDSTRIADHVVAITTLRKDAVRSDLSAVQRGVRFEARGGCLYVGVDQAVWWSGTTVRQKTGSREFEVLDSQGRKLAETGTTVQWGGGQISVSEAETYDFKNKLVIDPKCASRRDSYWLVGGIERPLFDSTN